MLFPGIRKMGKQLKLYSSGSTIFGQYRDYYICAYDGNNRKELLIKIQRSPKGSDLDSLKSKYKFKKCVYESVGSYLKIEFKEILKPYSYKKIIELTDEIIDVCKGDNIFPVIQCDSCDNKDIHYYQYNNVPLSLCPSCFHSESSKVNQAFLDFTNTESNYIQGLLGAVIFSIPGIIIQALLFIFLSRLGALSSVIYCYLALLGFIKFKGKPTPLSAILIIMVSLFMTISGTIISYSGWLFYETQDFQRVIELLYMDEIQHELQSNILLQSILSSLYLIIEFFSLRKKWSFKTIREAKSLF